MEQKRILVVDDERDLCEILCYNLKANGYQAEAVCSGEEALQAVLQSRFTLQRYDLLLLDVMMPGMSGFELATRLKADNTTSSLPIIFLTAKDTENDMLQGFGLGADDYIRKPFSVREVMARVNAVLGRASHHGTAPVLEFEGLSIDLERKTVTVDNESVALTKTEFELLGLLLSHRGQVFSRQDVLDRVWPHNVIVTERAVDVNITRLRKKIGRYGRHIVSRQGFGYVFQAKSEL